MYKNSGMLAYYIRHNISHKKLVLMLTILASVSSATMFWIQNWDILLVHMTPAWHVPLLMMTISSAKMELKPMFIIR